MKGFWTKLNRPFFALAPMYDVTDAAFRQIIARYGHPDVTFTEFVSVSGLAHPDGQKKLMQHLWFDAIERPIVAQVFGTDPEHFERAAHLCHDLGFDGIDINMGCPEKNVVKQGAGAALIRDPKRASDIIAATIAGAGVMPVSVKTRIGFHKEEIDQWLPHVFATNIPHVTVHLRTQREMSKVDAHWELMPHIITLRNAICPETLITGNGDVATVSQGRDRARQSGCDGIMIGRGVFGNPWVFDKTCPQISTQEKLRVMVEHTLLYEELFNGVKNFAIMKKHYKAYANGFVHAGELRALLMEARNGVEVERIVNHFLQHNKNI